jgi:tRNA pseudouridine55 synthase
VTSGLYVVDKPAGLTSHGVVARVRRLLGTRAVGHAGTLDPMATGVLLVLVGEAKKLAQYLTLEEKAYLAEVSFGRGTDTLDADGETVATGDIPGGLLDPEAVRAALRAEQGRTLQVPPAISAIKVGGARAHRLSRQGAPPDLPPRPISVRALELVSLGADRVRVSVTASKGYYVRSLARDLGERLGLPAHLSSLRRTQSGVYTLADAVPLNDVAAVRPLSEIDVARRCLPVAELSENGALLAKLGKVLSAADFVAGAPPDEGRSAWVFGGTTLVAIGEHRSDGFRVVRGFSGVSG